MKTARIVRAACAAGLAAACMCGIAACSSNESASGLTGGVAATVNGTEIAEDDVTTVIENLRASYSLEDQDAWGNYLASMGTTPDEIRSNVIDSFVEQELQKQGAEERGVAVEDSEIDTYVNYIKANYDNDEKWQQALQQAGFDDEAAYRENIKESLLGNALIESFTADDPTDDEIVEYASTAVTFDVAKRSSHILFDVNDQETAQSVLDQINAGTLDFAEAAKEYSTDTGSAENGGDVGWDQLTSFVEEYQTALDGLAVGQVSGLVESDYGWHIIKCTDEFTSPEEITSIDQLPQEFVDAYRDAVKQQKQQEAYQAWYDEYKAAADIVINDMPEGLPYAVDMPQYQTDDGSAEGDSTDDVSAETEDGASDEAAADESADSSSEEQSAESAETAEGGADQASEDGAEAA